MAIRFKPITSALAYSFITILLLTSSKDVFAGESIKKVRLLFPIEKGSEFDILSKYVVDPRLYTINHVSYLVAAELSDALVAFRLGKGIQAKTRLPFILAYDPDHPQADLQWMKSTAAISLLKSDTAVAHKRHDNYLSSKARKPDISSSSYTQARINLSKTSKLAIPLTRFKVMDCVPVSKCLSTISIKDINSTISNPDIAPKYVANYREFALPRRSPPVAIENKSSSLQDKLGKLNSGSDNSYHSLLNSDINPRSAISINRNRMLSVKMNNSRSEDINSMKTAPALLDSSADQISIFDRYRHMTISSVSDFDFADASLRYLFIRLDSTNVINLFDSLNQQYKPKAFYRIKGVVYAQVSVYSSSRFGKQGLGLDFAALVRKGFEPISLSPQQILELA